MPRSCCLPHHATGYIQFMDWPIITHQYHSKCSGLTLCQMLCATFMTNRDATDCILSILSLQRRIIQAVKVRKVTHYIHWVLHVEHSFFHLLVNYLAPVKSLVL